MFEGHPQQTEAFGFCSCGALEASSNRGAGLHGSACLALSDQCSSDVLVSFRAEGSFINLEPSVMLLLRAAYMIYAGFTTATTLKILHYLYCKWG